MDVRVQGVDCSWVVLGVEAIQEGAQHKALWGTDAQCAGREEMRTKSQSVVGW